MPTDLQQIESEVAEIYISTFGRAPDKAGLAYWVSEVVQGNLSVEQVSESFFDQQETQELYGDTSNEDFLISIYANTLGQDVDANDAGLQYWLGELEAGQYTRDGFIKTLINGAKAETGNANDALLLQNKVNAGLLYAKEIGVADSSLASEIMKGITFDAATAESAIATVQFYDSWVSEYSTALPVGVEITEDDLWKNINDDNFWQNLEAEHDLQFATAPSVNFWENDDVFWSDAPEGVNEFDFLQDQSLWIDETKFIDFSSGVYANYDDSMIFQQYAGEAGDMYHDLIHNNMDADIMETMFANMDKDVYDAVYDDMFEGLNDDYFFDIYKGEDGAIDQTKMAGVKGDMFNKMFDDYAAGDNFDTYFGGFDDDFFFDIYASPEGVIDPTQMAGMDGDMFNKMFDDYAAGDNFGTYFGDLDDDFFFDMYKGEDGTIDPLKMAGMEGDMFNNMFDDYAAGDNFGTYFGELDDDFFFDMYKGEDGAIDPTMLAGLDGAVFTNIFDDYASGDNFDLYFGDVKDDFFADGTFNPDTYIAEHPPIDGEFDPNLPPPDGEFDPSLDPNFDPNADPFLNPDGTKDGFVDDGTLPPPDDGTFVDGGTKDDGGTLPPPDDGGTFVDSGATGGGTLPPPDGGGTIEPAPIEPPPADPILAPIFVEIA